MEISKRNKKIPPSALQRKRGQTTQPEPYLYTVIIAQSGRKVKDVISNYLTKGKRNAVSSQRLADLAGCKSVRELQEVIAQERAAGEVILSTCENGGGYFLPESEGEVREFIRTLESRGKNTLAALK